MSDQASTKNVLITGASGGLGKALALECAGRGARVILLDRNQRQLERLCDAIEAGGAPAPGFCDVDLASVGPEALEELVAGLSEAYGGLHGVVHAAVRFDGLRPMDQIAPEDWLLTLQINLNVAWLLTVACLSSLREAGGKVLFLLDRDATGPAYWGAYGVSKAAVETLAATLAEELEGSDCEVIALDPGPMRTELRAAAYLAEDPNTVPAPDQAAARIADRLFEDRAASE